MKKNNIVTSKVQQSRKNNQLFFSEEKQLKKNNGPEIGHLRRLDDDTLFGYDLAKQVSER